jgi:hypothetical protein
MNAEDLAALLDQELENLDDRSDDEFFDDELIGTFSKQINSSITKTNGESDDQNYLNDDLHQLFLSSHLVGESSINEKVRVDDGRRETVGDSTQSSDNFITTSGIPYLPGIGLLYESINNSQDNSQEDEREILLDLMELIIASVEKVAPLCERTELTIAGTVSKLDDALISPSTADRAFELAIITNDDEVQVSPEHEVPNDPEAAAAIREGAEEPTAIWERKLQSESEMEKAMKTETLLKNEHSAWLEANAFKAALLEEKERQDARRRKREEQRVHALREKSAVSFLFCLLNSLSCCSCFVRFFMFSLHFLFIAPRYFACCMFPDTGVYSTSISRQRVPHSNSDEAR